MLCFQKKTTFSSALCLAFVAATYGFVPGASRLPSSRNSRSSAISPRMAISYTDESGPLSEASKGRPGELIRDYEPGPNTAWRYGKPDYTIVNNAYFEGRTKKWAEGSLELVVERLVKNWEVESHHISDIKQWQTMDISKFKAYSNGAGPISAQMMADIGPYNMMLGEMPACPFHASKETFETANQKFTGIFTQGFAWEVLEVFSGPPNVSFTWRHFGKATGEFAGYKGTGEMIEMFGHCLARVDKDLKISELHVYFDREEFGQRLTAGKKKGGVVSFLKKLIGK